MSKYWGTSQDGTYHGPQKGKKNSKNLKNQFSKLITFHTDASDSPAS